MVFSGKMVYGSANNVSKLGLLVCNTLLAISGLGIIVTSLMTALKLNTVYELVERHDIDASKIEVLNNYTSAFWALVVLGMAVVAIGFFGCVGIFCENSLLLSLFMTLVLVVFVVHIIVVVSALALKSEFELAFKEVQEKRNNSEQDNKFLEDLETTYACCALVNATTRHNCAYLGDPEIEAKGCFAVVLERLNPWRTVALSWSGVNLLIELFAMMITSSLTRAFRKEDSYCNP